MATFKQYLITEKFNRTEFERILSNPKFLIGMEFEYYDTNLIENTNGVDELVTAWEELYTDTVSAVDELEEAKEEAVAEGNKEIQDAIIELETVIGDLDPDEYEKKDYDKLVKGYRNNIDRLEQAKGEYSQFEEIKDLVPSIEYEHQFENEINIPEPAMNLLYYWGEYNINIEEEFNEMIRFAIFEYEDADELERIFQKNDLPIPQHGMESGFHNGDDFHENVQKYFNFEDFPFKNVKITTAENFKIWRIMEDGSLGLGGVEITSPVMTLKNGLNAMDMMFQFIRDNGDTVDAESELGGETGFHVNMSYKGFDLSKLDALKMILFMEEGFVSEEFPYRHASDYMSYILPELTGAARRTNLSKETIAFKRKLEGLKGKIIRAITPPTPNKGHGINLSGAKGKKGRVEFRYLGGEDYERKGANIRQQILRFAYMLELGMNPEFKKNEYIKKMSRFIEKSGKNKTFVNATKEFTAYDAVVKDLDGFIYRRDGDWVYKYKNGGIDKKGKELPDVKVQRIPLKRMVQMRTQNPQFFDGEFLKDGESL